MNGFSRYQPAEHSKSLVDDAASNMYQSPFSPDSLALAVSLDSSAFIAERREDFVHLYVHVVAWCCCREWCSS